MKEDFLHYVWKYKLFETSNLVLDNNEVVEILDFGIHNLDAGPDFFNGKINIGSTTWAGNIELHINASDWIKHKHQNDKAYDNVILHVVYNNDKPILDREGNSIPTLELKKLISRDLINNHDALINQSVLDIPCGNQLKGVDQFTISSWLNRLAFERLERKASEIQNSLKRNKNDWETTFYQYLFKYFGLKVNAVPFELLAQSTPLKIIEKHNTQLSIEALLFGQAGYLLNDCDDEYFKKLNKEYNFLKSKFDLEPLDVSVWKMLRLRPGNFPTIRIAQLANLMNNQTRLFAKIIDANSVEEVQKLFRIKASDYWKTHYKFGEEVEKSTEKRLGIATINSIIINVIIPFTFIYGKVKHEEKYIDKSIKFLEGIKAENNVIIKKWNTLGISSKNAMESQSLIEWRNNDCSQKKCLTCSIGNKILQT